MHSDNSTSASRVPLAQAVRILEALPPVEIALAETLTGSHALVLELQLDCGAVGTRPVRRHVNPDVAAAPERDDARDEKDSTETGFGSGWTRVRTVLGFRGEPASG